MKKNKKLERCYLKAELVLRHIFLEDARDSLVFKFTRIIHLEYWWFMSKYCLNSKLYIPSTINIGYLLIQSLTIAIVFELIQYTNGHFWGMTDIHEYSTLMAQSAPKKPKLCVLIVLGMHNFAWGQLFFEKCHPNPNFSLDWSSIEPHWLDCKWQDRPWCWRLRV